MRFFFLSFAVLGLAASTGLTPGQDRSHAPDQRESLATPNPLRSPAHATTNHTVLPRARSPALAQTLANHAPRADPKSKQSTSPEAAPKTNLPARSPKAARVPVRRVETRNPAQNLLREKTISSPSPQTSTLPRDPGLALDPDPPPRIDHLCNGVLVKM